MSGGEVGAGGSRGAGEIVSLAREGRGRRAESNRPPRVVRITRRYEHGGTRDGAAVLALLDEDGGWGDRVELGVERCDVIN